jgi:hypothetical protein
LTIDAPLTINHRLEQYQAMTNAHAQDTARGFPLKGKAMFAHHQYRAAQARMNSAMDNVYERISETDDYKKNENNLRLIQLCVVTVSAIATGFVNSLAHVERLGWPIAIGLALLITGFVEKFYFTLRHGLTTTYKSGKQRFFAQIWYRILQATMVLNATLLGVWIVGFEPPAWLVLYNHYSIGIHFAAALIGVAAVRDADAVIENRMLELKAETARQDLITARKTSAIGNPIVLLFMKFRGFLDACSLAIRLLFRGGSFAKDYVEQIETIAKTQYAHLNQITPPHGRQFPRQVSHFPTVTTPPKGPAQRP